ncbi:hypothetical protein [uncultured Nostoc sp.]|uniref:hypothetical protein n=1 Tax=uncultured Nostoc sp. TaxID=340711 RepID=UPI0026101E79|nr:hypothetical protein [uncultured Nostoc sp.]
MPQALRCAMRGIVSPSPKGRVAPADAQRAVWRRLRYLPFAVRFSYSLVHLHTELV